MQASGTLSGGFREACEEAKEESTIAPLKAACQIKALRAKNQPGPRSRVGTLNQPDARDQADSRTFPRAPASVENSTRASAHGDVIVAKLRVLFNQKGGFFPWPPKKTDEPNSPSIFSVQRESKSPSPFFSEKPPGTLIGLFRSFSRRGPITQITSIRVSDMCCSAGVPAMHQG